MYGGTALASSSHGGGAVGMTSSSPIPKQWWDQDPAQLGGVPPPTGQNNLPPSGGLHMNPGNGVNMEGSNNGVGMYQSGTTSPNHPPLPQQMADGSQNNIKSLSPPSSLPNNAGTAPSESGAERGYYRPGLRSPSPTIQKRLEGMPSNPNQDPAPTAAKGAVGGAYGNYTPQLGLGSTKTEATTSPGTDGPSRPPSSNGLIRLTLKKPMGIVFEPMIDPHNTSQQRGVRICDLPRTGAAALSRKLEIGDELLSINDKTMSRLTFDEIMDFIIEADPEKVNLLFRRPRKDQLKKGALPAGMYGAGSATGGAGSNPGNSTGNTVKWVDGKDGTASKEEATGPIEYEEPSDEPNKKKSSKSANFKEKLSSSKSSRRTVVDEESVMTGDDTMYTQETEDFRRGLWGRDKRRGRGDNGRYSESFLDMLIDSLCAPIVGEPPKRRGRRDDDDYYSDDDMTFNSADDSTYVTYDSAYDNPKKKNNRSEKTKKEPPIRGRGRDRTREEIPPEKEYEDDDEVEDDDEDDQDLEETNSKSKTIKKKSSVTSPTSQSSSLKSSTSSKKSKDLKLNNSLSQSKSTASESQSQDIAARYSSSKESATLEDPELEQEEIIPEGNYEDDATLETVETLERAKFLAGAGQRTIPVSSSTPLGLAPPDVPPVRNNPASGAQDGQKHQPQNRFEPQISPQVMPIMENEESTYEQDTNIPISELEYDDQVDHGADVSVMESLGGPSLLIENMRHNAAVAAGAAAATAVPAVNAELIVTYGKDYPAELGLTKEETIQLDPDKFYRHVVKGLLEEHEPEKVRLLDKLLAKYKGREEHLIQKLSVRYTRQNTDEKSVEEEKKDTSKKEVVSPKEEEIPAIDDDGFQTFGAFPKVTSKDGSKHLFSTGPWPPIGEDEKKGRSKDTDSKKEASKDDKENNDDASQGSRSSYTDSEYDSIDGTSPAVIAQVSELLNYVYGKTSVSGQIDRVSTIMRAYEGREGVLLELLETKALIKANVDNDEADNLPESLRNNPGLQKKNESDPQGQQLEPQIQSPVSNITGTTFGTGSEKVITQSDQNDDLSSMSGTAEFAKGSPTVSKSTISQNSLETRERQDEKKKAPSSLTLDKLKQNENVPEAMLSPDNSEYKKKKKGLFGGIFGGKKKNKNKGKESGGAFPSSDGADSKKSRSNILSPRGGKKGVLLSRVESEGSI